MERFVDLLAALVRRPRGGVPAAPGNPQPRPRSSALSGLAVPLERWLSHRRLFEGDPVQKEACAAISWEGPRPHTEWTTATGHCVHTPRPEGTRTVAQWYHWRFCPVGAAPQFCLTT